MRFERPDYLLFFLFGMVVVMEFVSVFTQVQLSTTGWELSRLQEDVRAVKRDNMQLREKLLSLTSLQYIQDQAKKQGFEEARGNDYLYLK